MLLITQLKYKETDVAAGFEFLRDWSLLDPKIHENVFVELFLPISPTKVSETGMKIAHNQSNMI